MCGGEGEMISDGGQLSEGRKGEARRKGQDSGVVKMWIHSSVHKHEYVVEANIYTIHTRNCMHLHVHIHSIAIHTCTTHS